MCSTVENCCWRWSKALFIWNKPPKMLRSSQGLLQVFCIGQSKANYKPIKFEFSLDLVSISAIIHFSAFGGVFPWSIQRRKFSVFEYATKNSWTHLSLQAFHFFPHLSSECQRWECYAGGCRFSEILDDVWTCVFNTRQLHSVVEVLSFVPGKHVCKRWKGLLPQVWAVYKIAFECRYTVTAELKRES